MTYYGNFSLPSSAEKQYALIYNTDAFDQVMEHVNPVQYRELLAAIDSKIAHALSIITSGMAYQMQELLQRMNDYTQNSEALFAGLQGEDMSKLVHNLASIGDVDEEKLVSAVFNAQKKEEASALSENPDDTGTVVLPFKQ